MKMTQIQDVYNFQTKVLNYEFPDKPTLLIGSHKIEQLVKITEELNELNDADTLSDQADALVDLVYFALGTLHQMGVDAQRVWDEVHRANMTKKRGTTKRGVDNDAYKPEEWKAPDHSWLEE